MPAKPKDVQQPRVDVGADFGVMDVSTDDPVETAAARLVGDRICKRDDIVHSVLDASFQIGRERPILIAKTTPHLVQIAIEPNREIVCAVAEHRQPASVLDDPIEHVSVQHQ